MNQGRSAPQLLRAEQVSHEQKCEREYEALQRNHRSKTKFGDDDAAREAAGSAAMLRAKELLQSGSTWRKSAKLMPRKLIGVRERVHTVGSARKCARDSRVRVSVFQSVGVCAAIGYARVLGPTHCRVKGMLASSDQRIRVCLRS